MEIGSNKSVHNTCLLILREQGFVLKVERDLEEEIGTEEELDVTEGEEGGDEVEDSSMLFWVAEKDGFCFTAENPIELLGLVAIYNYVRPKENVSYWWRKEGEDLWGAILDEYGS